MFLSFYGNTDFFPSSFSFAVHGMEITCIFLMNVIGLTVTDWLEKKNVLILSITQPFSEMRLLSGDTCQTI